MKQAVAVLCLALCVAAASAAGSKAPLFKDYLAGTKVKPQSGYYEEIERVGINFKAIAAKPMPNFEEPPENSLWTFVVDETHEEDYYKGYGSDSFADQGLVEPVSKCMITTNYNPEPLALVTKPGTSWVGNFYATCYLSDDKKSSLPETCDDTILSVTGVVYKVEQAVRVGPPGKTPSDSTRRAATKSAEAETQYYKEHVVEVKPADLPCGTALVWTGPFTVFSDSHPLKYKTGHLEFSVFPGGANSTITHQDAIGLMRLGDLRAKAEFVGEGKSRY